MTYQCIISAYQQIPSNTSKTMVHQSRMCVVCPCFESPLCAALMFRNKTATATVHPVCITATACLWHSCQVWCSSCIIRSLVFVCRSWKYECHCNSRPAGFVREKKAFVIVVRSFCACNPHCGENWIELHFNSSNYVTFELLGSGGRCTEPFISCGGWENHFCLFFWYRFSKLMWVCWQIFFLLLFCVPTQQKWDAGDAQCGEN